MTLFGLIMLVVLVTASITFWLSIRTHRLAYEAASAKIELAAVEKIKEILHEKNLELLKLNQELHFYRTLYSPDTDNTAIQVKTFTLHKDLATGQFIYDLVLTSIPKEQEKTSGVIGLSVDGKQQGALKRLVFENVKEITDTSLTFSFKYFQKLSGNFSLPDNFEPSKVHVELLRDNDEKESFVVSYNWDKVYK